MDGKAILRAFVGPSPQEYEDLQTQRLQNATAGQQFELNRLRLQEQKQDMADAEATRAAITLYGDLENALPALAGKVQPKTFQGLQTYLTEHKGKVSEIAKRDADAKKALADIDREEADTIGHLMLGVRQAGYSPALLDAALSDMAQHDRYRDEVGQIRQTLGQNPAAVNQIVDHLISQSPAAMERARQFDADKRLADQAAETVRHNTAMENQPTAEQRDFKDYYNAFLQGRAPNAALEWEARQKFATRAHVPTPGVDVPFPPEVQKQKEQIAATGAAARANSGGAQLTPEGLDVAAMQYAKTGVMPSLGMGAADIRKQIINRAAVLVPKLDVAANSADYAANKQSLGALQKSFDAVVSFENTANKNLDLLLTQGRRIIDSGSPLINAPLRTISKGVVGDADLPAYEAARRVAVNEIAKVTSNPNLTGQLSDAARREVEEFIPASATLAQVYRVAGMLRQDMKNRHESMADQIKAIKGRIEGGGDAGRGGPRPTHRYDPQTRTLIPIQ